MLFNSYIFIFVFLPITYFGFWGFNRFHYTKLAIAWLIVASLAFYGYWNFLPLEGHPATPGYFLLIIISLVFNHQIGEAISSSALKSKKARSLLILGIVVNIGLIAYYKYINFFLTSLNDVFSTSFPKLDIILPLGISFYSFTQIAYLVDVYKGETEGEKYDLPTYGLFIIFFPHLIAGPIVRYNELIPQFRVLKTFVFSHKKLALGLATFSIGLIKKVLIADNISPWVSTIFNHTGDVTFIEAWVGALTYTFQLYFDFSGYSDMAIGLSLMFNIDLPINFDSPYKSLSISDFWRRWHITLSNLLRDYLYIPLGGSRRGEARRYVNLIVTMFLGGLWHGAGWTFVIWGGLHGLFLAINHGWRKLNIKLPKFVAWLITFLAVVLTWVLFRAKDLQQGMGLITSMFGFNGIVLPGQLSGKLSFLTAIGIDLKGWSEFTYLPSIGESKVLVFFVLAALLIITTRFPNSQEIVQKLKPTWWYALSLGLLTSCALLSLNRVSEFLYFQF